MCVLSGFIRAACCKTNHGAIFGVESFNKTLRVVYNKSSRLTTQKIVTWKLNLLQSGVVNSFSSFVIYQHAAKPLLWVMFCAALILESHQKWPVSPSWSPFPTGQLARESTWSPSHNNTRPVSSSGTGAKGVSHFSSPKQTLRLAGTPSPAKKKVCGITLFSFAWCALHVQPWFNAPEDWLVPL